MSVASLPGKLAWKAQARALVVGIGAFDPLGANALHMATAARAGKLEPRPSGLRDRRGREIGMCLAPGVGRDVHGAARFVRLAAPALREALAWSGVASRRAQTGLPLVLALPEAGRPDDDERFGGEMFDWLAAAADAPIDRARSRVVRAGHAGGAGAIEAALEVLASGAACVAVGGVDSYFHPGVLTALDAAFRVHAHGVEEGFVPAEGAAFLVLARNDGRPDAAAPPEAFALLLGAGTGVEAGAGQGSDDIPNRAEAMTSLVGALLEGPCRAASGDDPAGIWVLSDLNGERQREREWAKVEARRLSAETPHWRLPDRAGDLGAATGPTMGVLACVAFCIGCAPRPLSLCALHADGPARGAFVLAKAKDQGLAYGETPAFRASVGVPAVHALERIVRAGPVPDAGRHFAADDAASGRARLARDCVEDIAALGSLRRPIANVPWARAEAFEARLLASLDALFALASGPAREEDVLALVASYAVEPAFADRGRAFAHALVLGCTAGDMAQTLMGALRRDQPATWDAYAEALLLASSPAAAEVARGLLQDPVPALVRLGLFVLRARRDVTMADAAPLVAHPDVAVAVEAARCLPFVFRGETWQAGSGSRHEAGRAGFTGPRDAVVALLQEMLHDDADDRVSLSAAESLTVLGERAGIAHARTRLAEEAEHPDTLAPDVRRGLARLLAMGAGERAGPLLLRAVRASPDLVEALGWHGDPAHVDALVGMLADVNATREALGGDPAPLERAIAATLHRITGAGLRMPEDRGSIRDADADDGGELEVDAWAWRAYWVDHGARFVAGTRYRFGRPFTPLACVDELLDDDALPGARHDCAFELALHDALGALETTDWVARQRAAATTIRAKLLARAT